MTALLKRMFSTPACEVETSNLCCSMRTTPGVTNMKHKALLLIVVCLLAICPLSLYGQANGSFSGTVTDKTGSVVSGAKVTITSQATGVTREAVTDDTGHYTAPLLPVSTYTV